MTKAKKQMGKDDLIFWLGTSMASLAEDTYKWGKNDYLTGCSSGQLTGFGLALGMEYDEIIEIREQQIDFGKLGQ